MTYGNQLSIFRAKAERYGPDWQGIVLFRNRNELLVGADDAKEHLKGRYHTGVQVLYLQNGARLRFSVVSNVIEAERAFREREFTQIAWMHHPNDEEIVGMARRALRSRTVPADDWRYEYCSIL